MDDDDLLGLLREVAFSVRAALDRVADWSLSGQRAGQYACDLIADAAALPVLLESGVGVLSEESGLHEPERDLLVVMDPVDGSTNASHRIPWYATSLCAVDADGPRVALVVNQATGEQFEARRGGGAAVDGTPVRPSDCPDLHRAVVAVSGYPARHLGWRQMRAMGSLALDLCAVASGRVDGLVDCAHDAAGVWDYLGGALVCSEAGAAVIDVRGRELVLRTHEDRRTVVAAGSLALLSNLQEGRLSFPDMSELD